MNGNFSFLPGDFNAAKVQKRYHGDSNIRGKNEEE
jgi:hypothetical protein